MRQDTRIIRQSSTPENSAQIGPFVFGSAGRLASASTVETAQIEQPSQAIPTSYTDLDSVQHQCERLIQDTQLKVSQIEKEAYEKGFSEGQIAGAEVGEKMSEALLKQYSASLDALNKLRKDVFSTSEHEVIRLALEIARKIIKREVAVDEELILTLVKVALARVAGQALITVRVSPKDYHFIERQHAAGSTEASALGETVKLVEDPLMS